MTSYDFDNNPAPKLNAQEAAEEANIAIEIFALQAQADEEVAKHVAVHCRQCGFWLGDPYFLAEHCPGDKPQEWGQAPEEVDWFCAAHAADLGMAELAEQDQAIWIGK
jgi:hypothetical protein